MLWVRIIAICFFSFTSLSLFLFQGIEFVKAFSDFFHQK
jgi:hypothetical protein